MSNPEKWKEVFDICVEKTRKNIEDLSKSYTTWSFDEEGKYERFKENFFDIGNWTTSFFTGMALLSYEVTKDSYYLQKLFEFKERYREKITKYWENTMHDLGFLYILYSVGLYKITGDKDLKDISLKATDEFLKRFNIKGNFIQAWGSINKPDSEYSGLIIVDSLMNLPLLFWAFEETGVRIYLDVAVAHANTIAKYLVREDYSLNHAYRFDIFTGQPIGPDNYCGYSVDSHWARGTAWAIYGLALCYKHTKDDKYLDIAVKIANKYLENVGDNLIPLWDFRLKPQAPHIYDTSAAVIAMCGFDETLKYHNQPNLRKYIEETLTKICNEYINADQDCRGILKDGQVGDKVKIAKNAYTSWGDYFLMEILARVIFKCETYW